MANFIIESVYPCSEQSRATEHTKKNIKAPWHPPCWWNRAVMYNIDDSPSKEDASLFLLTIFFYPNRRRVPNLSPCHTQTKTTKTLLRSSNLTNAVRTG